MSNDPLVTACRDAMECLETMPCRGIGADGPTLDEMLEHVERTHQPWGADATYHAAQEAWRRLERGLAEADAKKKGDS